MDALTIDNLCFTYGDRPVLQNLSLQLAKGESAALIGASGSGKTTLFNLITGMLQPLSGRIAIAGQSHPQAQAATAYMTQADLLLPWRTVMGNLTLPFELGAPVPGFQQEIKLLLEEMDLQHTQQYYPHQLSGGMRQRISLARTLLLQRPLLLLDEPFGSLDLHTREQMYRFLRRQKGDKALLMVTHDFRDATTLADRIFLLGNGRIVREWRLAPELRSDQQALHRIQDEIYLESSHASEGKANSPICSTVL